MGLTSKTWDENNRGFRKLTTIGVFSALFLMLSFILGISKYRVEKAAREAADRKAEDYQQQLIQRSGKEEDLFEIVIRTGRYRAKKSNAGTDSPVYITLSGQSGESGLIRLDTKNVNNFIAGKMDTFTRDTKPLGILTNITFRCDLGATPDDAGWLIRSCIVTDLKRRDRVYLANIDGQLELNQDKKLGGEKRSVALVLKK